MPFVCRICVLLIAAGFPAGWAGVSLAGTKEATEAYKAGDFTTALREFLPIARAGDAEAQNLVVSLIALGKGTCKDPDPSAAAWYAKAADQGHVHATTMLGWYYKRGLGVEQDAVKGYGLLSRAAVRGGAKAVKLKQVVLDKVMASLDELVTAEAHKHNIDMANAYYQVGKGFSLGHGVPRLPEVAAKAFEGAAARGHSAGQFELAMQLDQGDGVKEDVAKAFEWFSKLAGQGHPKAQAMVGRAKLLGRSTAVDRYGALVMIIQAKAAGSQLAQQVLDQMVK
ncbi:MAG: tetratricopeptide repeat protein [Rhodospirillaceae bacterium]